ncbi:hypothetical protein [Mucilaginibacter jinjuensis]|uniref:YD repeat-containing protein n=1 Tax=Mucilaginibacter jinjuensis TaxID=1176721 RepID=A0ABY7TD66_9SPHI|nr:hypothetical protein [Mucilaginibacter jinjuensis]WCT13643.1 hypothetical protein PQO05_06805 [Mucilaginibacter jinjuensis]
MNILKSLIKGALFPVLILGGYGLHAQEKYQPGKFIPPSPTAASLGVYGDFPVGYYSGTPNINIPIYNIKTANHNLNIALNYNASGTKPATEASWVGLGWSLSCGGVITRTVRGKDDFAINNMGYYNNGPLPPSAEDNSYDLSHATNPSVDYTFFHTLYGGSADGEPDIFNYNFGEFAGKFVLGKSTDGSPIYMDAKNNLKFIYSNGEWIVTDAKGYQYHFATQEISEDWFAPGTSIEFTAQAGLGGLANDFSTYRSANAWYLDYIVSPTSEKVQFEYSTSESFGLLNKSEQQYFLTAFAGGGCTVSSQLPGNYKTYGASKQLIHDIFLKKISFANGSLEFGTTIRDDIEFPDANQQPVKLSTITLKNTAGQPLKVFHFNYNYFSDLDNTKRLKLESMVESDPNGNVNKPYVFSYFDYNGGWLPPKLTKDIDHWGFYNNAGNQSLLPLETLPISLNSLVLDGGSREPELSGNYIKSGVLSSIKYPTGGHTDFDYELHDYSNLIGDEAFMPSAQFASVSNNDPNTLYKSVEFDITKKQIATIAYVYDEYNCAPCNPNGVTDIFAALYKDGQAVPGLYNANSDGTLQNVGVKTLGLDVGHYTLTVKNIPGYTTSATLNYNTYTPVTQKIGGGIRVKSIISYDNAGNSIIKRLQYTKGINGNVSSGRLLSHPLYDYQQDASDGQSNGDCTYLGHYVVRSSSSIDQPGLSASGTVIGYDKVTELIGNNGEGGKTEYYYYNIEESKDAYPNIPTIGDIRNGKLIRSIAYDNLGNPVNKKEYDYEIKETNSIKGVKAFGLPFVTSEYPIFWFRFYDNLSTWFVNSVERDVTYTRNDSTVTVTNMTYDNNVHRQLTTSTLINSIGNSIKHVYNYPSEMVANGNDPTGIYTLMVNANMLSPVIEDIAYKNTSFTEKTKTNYSNQWTNQNIKPQSIESQVLGNSSEPRLSYTGYDKIGNVLSLSQVSGPPITYLWGYNNQYPVAEIKNATYQAVVNALGQSIIDGLNSSPGTDAAIRNQLAVLRTALPNAQVTIYTYAPLIGMTSTTDAKGIPTYYEYDSFLRLMNIKDKDGNIVKHVDYHYQNQ